MARKRKRAETRAGELNLVAMIDVAFQLLSFFLITVHPVDVFANLDVMRPTADKSAPKDAKVQAIRIIIAADGYLVNDRFVDLKGVDTILTKLAELDKTQTILIACKADSPHGRLIDVLDICAKTKLVSLSVVSTN